jgi:hypothetical protein
VCSTAVVVPFGEGARGEPARFGARPEMRGRDPTAWLGISDSNFDVQREYSSL